MTVYVLMAAGALFAAGVVVLALLWRAIRRRNAHLWLPSYLRRCRHRRRTANGQPELWGRHVLFCIADHYEPGWGGADFSQQRKRIGAWVTRYPPLALEFTDADGRHPRHTFFYPIEEYHPDHLEALAGLVRQGLGEVEVHLHHDQDTSEGLTRRLEDFKKHLRAHGLLGRERGTGAVRFGFVHGNWALDNSRPDGRWCGVNDELRVLSRCGCYADFTLPSAPDPTQTTTVNSIYYATDDPEKPKSHDRGVAVAAGGRPQGDLLIIQGPLALSVLDRRWGLLPRIETGEISCLRPPTPGRVQRWAQQRICVRGREEWIFVKVHTHGCQEENLEVLLGEPMRVLHEALAGFFNDGQSCRLHYVTAREMYNIVKAAEAGYRGNPYLYRDFLIGPPPIAAAHRQEAHLAGVV